MWPKLQNIGEKWFILSFDLRVFIEKGTILIKKRHCLTAMYQFALLAKKDTATKRCLLWGNLFIFSCLFGKIAADVLRTNHRSVS